MRSSSSSRSAPFRPRRKGDRLKLHVKTPAPSALRVQVFLDECARSLEEVEVPDTRSPEFLKINPFGTVPVLETDLGEMISESLTICRYLDRQWDTGLFGA